jgi:hypothetical protein
MHQLKAEGMTQNEMYALFERHCARHAGDADQTTYDYICDMMDLIVGWCSPESQLFDPPPPPSTLNGADVVLWVNSRKPYCTILQGMTHHGVRAIAICRTRESPEVHLFRCYVDWTVIDSMSHASAEQAMLTAKQWGVGPSDWHVHA